MPLFPGQPPPAGAGPPGMPAAMAPPPATPPPFMGGSMPDMIGMMAMKAAMEPSTDKVRRALSILDDARKTDERVAPNISMAMDILRNGPEAITGSETRLKDKPNNSFRPSTSMGLY